MVKRPKSTLMGQPSHRDYQKPVRVLPNGDLWSPVNGPGVPNVEPPEPKVKLSQEERLQKALTESEGYTCPWCDLPFEGGVSLKRHILENHKSLIASDEEKESQAGQAAVIKSRAAAPPA